jgi:hypothetical protein
MIVCLLLPSVAFADEIDLSTLTEGTYTLYGDNTLSGTCSEVVSFRPGWGENVTFYNATFLNSNSGLQIDYGSSVYNIHLRGKSTLNGHIYSYKNTTFTSSEGGILITSSEVRSININEYSGSNGRMTIDGNAQLYIGNGGMMAYKFAIYNEAVIFFDNPVQCPWTPFIDTSITHVRSVFASLEEVPEMYRANVPSDWSYPIAALLPNKAPVFTSDDTNRTQTIAPGDAIVALKADDPNGAGDIAGFTVTSGSLPPGITLNNDGTFSGSTNISAGSYNAEITVTDKGGLTATTNFNLTLNNAAPSFAADATNTTQTLMPGDVLAALKAVDPNGISDITGFAVTSGSLPPGVTLNNDGTFSGGTNIPVGSYSATIKVTDKGGLIGTTNLTITALNIAPSFTADAANTSQTISPGGTLTALKATDPNGISDIASFAVTSGSLPTGVTLNNDGTFSGSTNISAGSYNATITVTDKGGLYDRTDLNITITNAAPSFTTATTNTSQTISKSDSLTALSVQDANGVDDIVGFTVTSGSLPTGITLNNDGTFSGSADVGFYTANIQVEDKGGATAVTTLKVSVLDIRDIHVGDGETFDLSTAIPGNTIVIDENANVTLIGTAPDYVKVQCSSGVNLTLDNATLNNTADDYCALSFTGSGNTLNLVGTSHLESGQNQPAIKVEGATELIINGTGELFATGGAYGAGIGSSNGNACGNITINSGKIFANGTNGAAGIGGGFGGQAGNINILGGEIYASGDTSGGAQDIGSGAGASGGALNISGDTTVFLEHQQSGSLIPTTTLLYWEYANASEVPPAYSVPAGWSYPIGLYMENKAPRFTADVTNTSQTILTYGTPTALIALDPNGAGDIAGFSLIGGSLPTGITLNSDGSFSGSSAVGNYSATIQVADKGGLTSTTTLNITVKDIVVTALPETVTLGFDEKQTLTATTEPAENPINWISSDTSIATVDLITGEVTAGTKQGRVVITAYSTSGYDTCTIYVLDKSEPAPAPSDPENILTVKIRDDKGNPIVGYCVSLFSDPQTVMTDSNGMAVFNNIPYNTNAPHTLIVQSPVGLEIKRYNVNFAKGMSPSTIIDSDNINVTFDNRVYTTNITLTMVEDRIDQVMASLGFKSEIVEKVDNPQTGYYN